MSSEMSSASAVTGYENYAFFKSFLSVASFLKFTSELKYLSSSDHSNVIAL